MANLVDKVKDKLTGHHTESVNPETCDTKAANKAEPRFDPVLDAKSHSTVPGDSTTSTGSGTAGGNYGTTDSSYGTTGSSYSTNAGPHDNNLANKMDPRVDSDLDHRANPASSVPGSTDTGMTHTTSGIGTGTGNTTGTGLGNTTGTGMTGSGITSGVPGSAAIPGDNTGNLAPTGLAPNTAGPHANDMGNKLDPRVDSDLDGSRTLGGNRT